MMDFMDVNRNTIFYGYSVQWVDRTVPGQVLLVQRFVILNRRSIFGVRITVI